MVILHGLGAEDNESRMLAMVCGEVVSFCRIAVLLSETSPAQSASGPE